MTSLTTPTLFAVVVAFASVAGCTRGGSTEGAPPAKANGSEAADAAPSQALGAREATPSTRRFEGTYEAQPGSMYIPRDGDVPNAVEWAGTKFRSDDAGVGRGAGTIAMVVASDGAVSGEGAGSLGPFTLVGQRAGERLVGTLRGSGPEAFFGTFDLELRGGEASGGGRLSDGEARVVRSFTAKLTAK